MDAAPEAGDPLATEDTAAAPPVAPGATPPASVARALPEPAPSAPPPAAVADAADTFMTSVRARLANFPFSRADNKDDIAGVNAYYALPDSQPVWTSKDGVTQKGREIAAEIGRARSWGLDPAAFELPDLQSKDSAGVVEAIEIKLSLAALKYARHARGGRIDPAAISPLMDRKPVIYDPKTVLLGLAAASAPDRYLQGLHPKHPQFAKLRQALASSSRGGDAPAPAKIPAGPDFRLGDRHPQIALLRQRLKVSPGGDADVYDGELEDAVRRQQQASNLRVTGVVDKKLRAALNESVGGSSDEKRERILVNMERWRWMPEDLGHVYVWDSITEQVTRVFIGGKESLREKIVVGRATTPTPQFTAKMQFVIFHPEWGVPDGIKTNEIAPRLKRYAGDDGGFLFFGGGNGGASRFLKGQGLRVSLNGREVDPDSVNWGNVDVRKYQFIQPSGGRNVLGIVKFRFPNKHDVYMHDTPEKRLFEERVRAFSHGCMRTQNPIHLAEVLLAQDKGWSASKIKDIVDRGALEEVKLTNPIPVHVTYFTAEVGDDGNLRTYNDLYGLDGRIASALAGRPIPIASQQVAAVEDDGRTDPQPERPARNTREPRDGRNAREARDSRDTRDQGRARGERRRFNAFEGLFD